MNTDEAIQMSRHMNPSNPEIARKLGKISCDLLIASISKGIAGIFMKKLPPRKHVTPNPNTIEIHFFCDDLQNLAIALCLQE